MAQDNCSCAEFFAIYERPVRACQIGQAQITMYILEQAMVTRQNGVVYGDLTRSGASQTATIDRYGETPPRHRPSDAQQFQLSIKHYFLLSAAHFLRDIRTIANARIFSSSCTLIFSCFTTICYNFFCTLAVSGHNIPGSMGAGRSLPRVSPFLRQQSPRNRCSRLL